MNFYIRQGATDPILKLKLLDDGKNDKSSFNTLLETATITFEMFDVVTNEYVILNSPCSITTRIKKYNSSTDEYYIVHRFTTTHTANKGVFEGKITIVFEDANILMVPITEKLFINVI
jgi:hypothetical protein